MIFGCSHNINQQLKTFILKIFKLVNHHLRLELFVKEKCFIEKNSEILQVDFLDTAGDDQFPVMRRLSISSGIFLNSFRYNFFRKCFV